MFLLLKAFNLWINIKLILFLTFVKIKNNGFSYFDSFYFHADIPKLYWIPNCPSAWKCKTYSTFLTILICAKSIYLQFFCAVAWFYNSPIVYLSNFLIFGVVILCGIFMVYTYSAIFLKYHRLLVLKDIRRAQDFDEISGIADLTASVIERDHELTPQELLLLKKCVVITGSFILLWVPYFSKVLVEMILHEQSSSLLEVLISL